MDPNMSLVTGWSDVWFEPQVLLSVRVWTTRTMPVEAHQCIQWTAITCYRRVSAALLVYHAHRIPTYSVESNAMPALHYHFRLSYMQLQQIPDLRQSAVFTNAGQRLPRNILLTSRVKRVEVNTCLACRSTAFYLNGSQYLTCDAAIGCYTCGSASVRLSCKSRYFISGKLS